MEERRSTRLLIHCPIVFLGENLVGKGTVIDLSLSGCGVQTTTLLRRGLSLSLSVTSPDEQAPIDIHLATVRWALGGKCGLEFIRMGAEQRERLCRLVQPPSS